LVAIDIAKARHEVLIATPGKKRRRRLTVLNQRDDFKRLIALLCAFHGIAGSHFTLSGRLANRFH